MESVLIVIHLLIVAALVVVVLLQRSEGGALGIGGGGGGGFLTGRSAANLLTRTTAILAAGFFVTSLGLTILAGMKSRPSDVLDQVPVTTGAPTLSVPQPADSDADASTQDGGTQSDAPASPQVPTNSGPQVPTSQ
ncbi:preprotein translocase subunit SecG [uncultured Cohaesibacter sp.]|uniref:preprotein translocase subunit SecG n=1 Tax=uncultured Cohaesibacter sp. TaxID=1002546 RepID=UPI00293153A9|nr:preprotein translocase subunit SecG [uncultured Cohaesibacter sp.]